ncbi:MAG: hypothetical protein NZ700_03900, partial [Gemmataceae bacterium]|nr:hypothetical protein [Gemmataceae bacterium]
PADGAGAAADDPLAQRQRQIAAAEHEAQQRLELLERLASELADQRLHLAEQLERLVQAQENWQREHDAAAAALTAVAQRLAERERVLEIDECRVRHQLAEVAQTRQQLESWELRLGAREAAWESERERLVADIRLREQLVARRLHALHALHERWVRRRRQEVSQLQAAQAANLKVYEETVALRQEWLRRNAALEQEQRSLAERALAVEQYRQELLRRSPQSAAAAKRIEKLRRRWVAASAAARRALDQEREALRDELESLKHQRQRLQARAQKLAAIEAELANRYSAWERRQLLAQDINQRLRHQLQAAVVQRDLYVKERDRLRLEVERFARALLGREPTPALPAARAA